MPLSASFVNAEVEACPLRVEGEGEGEGEPALGARAGLVGRSLRHILPLAAAVLVVAATRRRIDGGKAIAILGVCAVLAVGTHTLVDRSTEDRYVNGWEFFHYYLGSKYLPELGYTGLYAAALTADDVTGLKYRHERQAIRNLETGGCVPAFEVLLGCQSSTYNFSSERWAEFKRDILHFKSVLSPAQWNGLFRDKGYNATPVWTMVASALTSRVSTSSRAGLLGLSLLDPLLLILAVAVVWRTFDARTALLMVILIGTHMAMSHSHMKGALLRTDWVVAMILAVCAVKAKRPLVGGALAAWAAASRVFPLLFVAVVMAGLVIGVRQRACLREPLRFAVGFVVALGLLIGLATVATPAGTWSGFADKIWQHHDSFSPWRVGFKTLFLGAYDYRADGLHQEVFRERWLGWWTIQALVLAGLVFLSRRLASWEKLALGFVPIFFFTAPTYYYYIMLAIPLLFFCGRMHRLECALGAAWLLASSSIAYLFQDAVGRELPLFYVLSLIVLSICALMAYSAWKQLEPEPSPPVP